MKKETALKLVKPVNDHDEFKELIENYKRSIKTE